MKLISKQFEINHKMTANVWAISRCHNTQTLKRITHIKQTVRHSLQPFSAACTNVKVLLITMNTIVQGMVYKYQDKIFVHAHTSMHICVCVNNYCMFVLYVCMCVTYGQHFNSPLLRQNTHGGVILSLNTTQMQQ